MMEYKINADDYKDLRIAQLDIQVAQLEEKVGEKSCQLIDRDVEIARMKSALSRHSLTTLKAQLKDATDRYVKLRELKEANVGCSLDGAIIDEVTLTVTPLDKL